MNLYLVQHARPKPEEEDPDRHLSKTGWAEIGRVGAHVAEGNRIKVNCIYHSGKARARETAEALVLYFNPPDGVKETVGLKPMDDPSIWIDRLAGTKEDMMIVGHLPHLGKLASKLLSQNRDEGIVEFQMGGIVCLTRDEEENWSLRWTVTPQTVA